jgi:hypothetical protein
LEIKIILAMMLMGYDYTVVDEHGNQAKKLPEPNRNDLQVSIVFFFPSMLVVVAYFVQALPLGKPVYLKLKRRD